MGPKDWVHRKPLPEVELPENLKRLGVTPKTWKHLEVKKPVQPYYENMELNEAGTGFVSTGKTFQNAPPGTYFQIPPGRKPKYVDVPKGMKLTKWRIQIDNGAKVRYHAEDLVRNFESKGHKVFNDKILLYALADTFCHIINEDYKRKLSKESRFYHPKIASGRRLLPRCDSPVLTRLRQEIVEANEKFNASQAH